MKVCDQVARPKGLFRLWVYRKGILIDQYVDRNTIVDDHKAIQAHLIGGDVAQKSVTKIGFGQNGTAASPDDKGLTGAFVKTLDSHQYPAVGSVEFAFSLGQNEGNSLSIREFGLLCEDGTLFARKVRGDVILKDSEISLSGLWTIIF